MASNPDVVAARTGDREAFGRLYRRYARPVFLELASRVGSSQDAEDALQATFLAAWTKLPRLRRPSRFVAWLFSIARNKARDQMRGVVPRVVLVGNDVELFAARGQGEADVDGLRELVAGLKPKSRAIILLRVVEGWSAKEVAAAQGVSVSTVRRKYAEAIQHLRVGLERSKSNDKEDRRSHPVQL